MKQGWRTFFSALLLAALLAACGDKEPVRIGFIGGTSGRVADLGIAGRNAVQLAVDLANQKGGIDGRKIELIVRDDEQNPEVARQRFKELVTARVSAVVGPMTSGMAVAVMPLINEHRLLAISPTSTADELGGKDDFFFRVLGSAGVYAALAARYQHDVQGVRRVAIIYDNRNRAYSESWAREFQARFEQLGGKVASFRSFNSGDEAGLSAMAEEALRSAPETVVVVANSVDAALLTQHLRRRSPTVRLALAEWAATERYIELAGKSSEGAEMAQFFDRSSTVPSYLEFRRQYRERFGEDVGFGSVTAFDAMNVLIESMSRQPGLTPKEAVMSIRKFAGVQNPIVFDATGDGVRDVFMTAVRDGQYVILSR